MKILYFCPLKPVDSPVPSGDREIARGLLEFLESQGHEVEILSSVRTKLFWQRPGRVFLVLFEFLAAFFRALRFRPDAFFTYHFYYKAPDPYGPWLAALFRKPYFVFEGMYGDRPRLRWATWPGWWLTRHGLARAQHVFSDKADDLEGLRRILAKEKISHVPPSLDLNFFRPDPVAGEEFRKSLGIPEGATLVVGAAMLRPDRKSEGVLFLLRAMAKLNSGSSSFYYLHLGGGSQLDALREEAARLLGEKVRFVGQVDRAEVVRHFQAADFFAFPGIDESFGLVYAEAQACGLPVVAFDNGGVPGAVQAPETAFLTPLLDEAAMVDSLSRLIFDAALRRKMGAAARAFTEKKFDRRQNYAQIERELRRATAGASRH